MEQIEQICSSCGAPLTSGKCDYCGTEDLEFAKQEKEKQQRLRLDEMRREIMLADIQKKAENKAKILDVILILIAFPGIFVLAVVLFTFLIEPEFSFADEEYRLAYMIMFLFLILWAIGPILIVILLKKDRRKKAENLAKGGVW